MDWLLLLETKETNHKSPFGKTSPCWRNDKNNTKLILFSLLQMWIWTCCVCWDRKHTAAADGCYWIIYRLYCNVLITHTNAQTHTDSPPRSYSLIVDLLQTNTSFQPHFREVHKLFTVTVGTLWNNIMSIMNHKGANQKLGSAANSPPNKMMKNVKTLLYISEILCS